MFNKHPFLSRLCVFIILPAILVTLYFYRGLIDSEARVSGSVEMAGLQHKVDVSFSNMGVPTVNAQSDLDAYFAQGYLHGANRLWQMELQRRLAHGRLSEIFGLKAVSSDIWMRTLGLSQSAHKALSSLSSEAKSALEAYAAGVNAAVENNPLPPEFSWFGITPEPWRPEDSLVWQKTFALNMGQNMFAELSRKNALKRLSPQQLQTFFIYDHKIADPSISAKLDHQSSAKRPSEQWQFDSWDEVEQFYHQWSLAERFVGSNSWAVSGKYTASGSPLLANDPHLTLQTPSLWYAIKLKGDRLNVSGMSLIGLPGVIAGRNDDISWGITNLMSDQQDLFYIDIPAQNNRVYRTDEGDKPIHTRLEYIKVSPDFPALLNKQIEPIAIRVRTTDLGPIVSDVVSQADSPMVLRWAALDETDKSYNAFYKLQYAHDWQQFRSALNMLQAPGLNFVYADTKGNIGAQAAGRLPMRGAGEGILPLPAYRETNRWRGYVPFEHMPSQYNPPSGVVVSANSRIKSRPDVVISHEWAPDTRFKRISALLSQYIKTNKAMTSSDMANMQMDTVDVGALKLLPKLLRQTATLKTSAPSDLAELSEQALTRLSSWQGNFTTDSSAATIYRYWVDNLVDAIFRDELDPKWTDFTRRGLSSSLTGLVYEGQLVKIVDNPDNGWCQREIQSNVGCRREIIDSFYSALRAIAKQTESHDIDDWQWGELHYIEYAHQPLGQMKLLSTFFSLKKPSPGTMNTIDAGNAIATPEGDFRQTFGAGFRQVFDMSSPDGDQFMISGGQSGHFMSDDYNNMVTPFLSGKLISFDGNPPNQTTTLTLVPRSSK